HPRSLQGRGVEMADLPRGPQSRFAYDLSATDISQTKSDYLKLSVSTARRMLRFWLVRGATKTDA
ncbi:MAG: hypothetical protein WCC80_10340, partial [Pseudolabrys sp.]